MHHPVLFPTRCGAAVKHRGLSQRLAEFGTQHDRAGLHRDPAICPGWQPLTALAGKPAGRHQVVHRGMVVQGAGARGQHPDHPDRSADNPGIVGARLEGCGGSAEAGVVEELWVAAGQFPQRLGQGKGDQAIGDRQEPLLWPLQPRIGRAVLAGGTMAGLAGMIALRGLLAVFTEIDVTAKRCCAAVFDRCHGPHRAGQHWVLELGPIGGAMPAEALCEFDHPRSSMRRWRATPAISCAWRGRWG
jgi:hypothetical protein